jgi:hypothetical protein
MGDKDLRILLLHLIITIIGSHLLMGFVEEVHLLHMMIVRLIMTIDTNPITALPRPLEDTATMITMQGGVRHVTMITMLDGEAIRMTGDTMTIMMIVVGGGHGRPNGIARRRDIGIVEVMTEVLSLIDTLGIDDLRPRIERKDVDADMRQTTLIRHCQM